MELSVSYHKDGNVMYKIVSNFKPLKYPPISKLAKPVFFLRINGFSINDLHSPKKKNTINQRTISLRGISRKSPLSCDIYLSGQTWGVKKGDADVFRAGQVYTYHDQDAKIALHFHFYKTENREFYVVVPQRGWYKAIEKRILYFWYRYIKPKF